MTDLTDYIATSGSANALVADLSRDLALAESDVLREGPGWAILRDGTRLDLSDALDRPLRIQGTTYLDKPEDFARFVTRHETGEAAIFADKRNGRLTAVFNGALPSDPGDDATRGIAGYGDHRAVVNLVPDEDWTAWIEGGQRMIPQAAFGELIEGLAHTMVSPDGASMLEVALTLTASSKIDYSSRVRLDNGDMAFKFEQDTNLRAGRRGSEVEVPTEFTFRAAPWEGANPVDVTARLRVKPGNDGVLMGYRLMRVAAALDSAFDSVITNVAEEIPDGLAIFRGAAPGDRRSY